MESRQTKACFISVEALAEIWVKQKPPIVIWGTNDYGMQIFHTLCAYGITITCFGDNNINKHGKKLYEKLIISADTLCTLDNPFIVIASYGYQVIFQQLYQTGIRNIYVLEECLKYPLSEILQDHTALQPFFDQYKEKKSDKLLIEMYGNFGDIVITEGIIQALIGRFGKENVYFLVENIWDNANEQFIRLFTDHVFSIHFARFCTDRGYRRNLLEKINGQYFQMAVSICYPIAVSRRRLLNNYNFNVAPIFFNNRSEQYVLDLYTLFLQGLFCFTDRKQLFPIGSLKQKLNHIQFPFLKPKVYAAVAMGASNPAKLYDVQKFAVVMEYFITIKLPVVMLGYGEQDELFYQQLLSIIGETEYLINGISKCSILESIYAVAHSCFFLGTDSGLWNASYVLGKESVVLYGRGEYGNFLHKAPYIHYVMADEKPCSMCSWFCTNRKENGYAQCLGDITPEQIINAIKKVVQAEENKVTQKAVAGIVRNTLDSEE